MPPSDSADERRGLRQGPGDSSDIAGERVGAVVPVDGPVAVTVTAQVDAVGAPPPGDQRPGGGVPGVAGLPAAMEQHDGWVPGVARQVGRQLDAIDPGEAHSSGRGDDGSSLAWLRLQRRRFLPRIKTLGIGCGRIAGAVSLSTDDDSRGLRMVWRYSVARSSKSHFDPHHGAGGHASPRAVPDRRRSHTRPNPCLKRSTPCAAPLG